MPGRPTEEVAAPRALPLLGRERETAELGKALERARSGQGESWAILGPGGMGKTRLLRWLEAEAQRQGFELRGGACLRESIAPFFPFEQAFRGAAPSAGPRGSSESPPVGPLSTLLLVEEARPRRFWTVAEAQARQAPLLVVSRDRPATLRASRPALSGAKTILCLTRLEGPDNIAPGALDALGERLEQHLRGTPGSIVAMEGLEYLVSQGSFAPVLRLMQFLRDVAEDSGGHLVVAVNPSSLEARETSLLESDAEVLRDVAAASEGAGGPPRRPEPPSAVLLRYLSTLEAACRVAPQLVLVDDLQWADAPSVAAFQFLARNLRSLPVLLVGAMRDETTSGSDAAATAMEEAREALQREGLLHATTLRGLTAEDVRRMGAAVASARSLETRDAEALESLARRTEGNPYFLREIFFQLLEDGRLRREGEVAVLDLPSSAGEEKDALPETIRRLVVRRLQALTPSERAFLDCASVAGSEFDLGPITGVLGISPADAQERVESLHRRHRLVDPAGDRWCCAHPLVWEVTLTEMPPSSRQRLARELATWWVAHRSWEVEVIARLYHEAGDADAGRPWVRKAIQEALGRLSGETVAVYLRWLRSLRRSRPSPAWEELREEARLAQEIDPLGNALLARDLLKDLLDEDPPQAVRGEVLAWLAWVSRDVDLKTAEATVANLEAFTREHPEDVAPLSRAFGSLTKSQVLAARLDHAAALGCLDDCQRVLDSLPPGDSVTRVQASVWSQRIYSLVHVQRSAEAIQVADEAIARLQGRVSPITLMPLINARGVTKRERGEHPGAYADFRECARLSRESGRILAVCIGELNAVGCLAALGDLDRGERLARGILDLSRKFSLLRAETGAHAYLAELSWLRDRWDQARDEATIALEQSRRTGRALWLAEMEGVLATVKGMTAEDPAAGRADLERLLSSGAINDGDSFVAMVLLAGRIALKLHDASAAREHLRRAKETLAARSTSFLAARALALEAELAEEEGHAPEAEDLRTRARGLLEQARKDWPEDRVPALGVPPSRS
jgi:hypothetical protein